MIDWPTTLISELARRRTIPVLGSGVSRHAVNAGGDSPPLWKGFLEKCASTKPDAEVEHILTTIEEGDYLHACEWLKKLLADDWKEYLRSVFTEPEYIPAAIHTAIHGLDSRVVFSLNFDNIYERYVNSEQGGSLITKTFYDEDVEEFLRGTGRFVIKLHGNLDTADKLIFTQRDYADARIKHASFYKALDASILTHSLLFIGAGFSDPDVNLLLENQNFTFPSAKPHYFLTADEIHADFIESMKNNRNLKVIRYDKVDDSHSGLVGELENLSEAVESERESLIRTNNW